MFNTKDASQAVLDEWGNFDAPNTYVERPAKTNKVVGMNRLKQLKKVGKFAKTSNDAKLSIQIPSTNISGDSSKFESKRITNYQNVTVKGNGKDVLFARATASSIKIGN